MGGWRHTPAEGQFRGWTLRVPVCTWWGSRDAGECAATSTQTSGQGSGHPPPEISEPSSFHSHVYFVSGEEQPLILNNWLLWANKIKWNPFKLLVNKNFYRICSKAQIKSQQMLSRPRTVFSFVLDFHREVCSVE